MTARAASDHEHAFPRLTAAEVDALRPRGTVRAVDAGTVLFAEGDRDFSFFVVLSGAVEIVDASRGALRTVAVHEPGEFTATWTWSRAGPRSSPHGSRGRARCSRSTPPRSGAW
jgi:CRP-like cAMP-binding protein